MLVSVIIPAYNQEHFIEEAVQSALMQTYANVEVIVIDDGSSDDTREKIAALTDTRIRYYWQQNKGLSAARNTGIRLARGEFLTFLDSDDRFLPEKIARLCRVMIDNPHLGFTAGQAILIDENGRRIPRKFESVLPARPQDLLLGNPFHVGSVLLRKDWQEKTGFFDENLRSYEDWDYWLRLSLAGCPMEVISEPVSEYRFHTAQMTRNGQQMTAATMAVLEKTFARFDLPTEWAQMKASAYANAYLRAAAHHYLALDFSSAREHLIKAIDLNPDLARNGAAALAAKIAGWSDLPKSDDPIQFIDSIYSNLPEELSDLKGNRQTAVARIAVQTAFETFQSGDFLRARKAAIKAIQNNPVYLFNRGIIAILMKSTFTNHSRS